MVLTSRKVFVWFILPVVCNYWLLSEAVITIQPLNLEVFAGEDAVFECNTDILSSTSTWKWFKGGDTLISTEDVFVTNGYEVMISNRRTTSTLTIPNTFIEDGDTYHCQFGVGSPFATLTVIERMRLDSKYPQCYSDMTSINTEKTAHLRCSAKGGDPKPELQWYRNGVKLSENQDFVNIGTSSYFEKLTHVLTIDDEETVFMCKAEGQAADKNQSCQLQLTVPPDVYIISNATSFTFGGSLFLTCLTVSPWKITDYIWTINNELLLFSELKYILKNDGRGIDIFDVNHNYNILIRCDVTTSSGLVGSDTIEIKHEDETSDDPTDLILIVCLSVGMFFLGLCIGILVKFSTVLKSFTSVCKNKTDSDKIRSGNQDTSTAEPCYQNTIIENDQTVSGEMTYSGLVPTTPSIYTELNKIKVNE